jgi:hypothetical protein
MCSPDLLLAGAYEILAQAIHHEYGTLWERRGEQGLAADATLPWAKLPESRRESIRVHATQLGPNLQEAGCFLSQLTDLNAEDFTFRAEEMEPLASRERERWFEEGKRLGGGWEDLGQDAAVSRAVTEVSQEFVRALPRILGKAGLQIVRPEGAVGTGPTLGDRR